MLALKRDLKSSFKGDINIINVDIDVDVDRYVDSFKGLPKAVQVLLTGYRSSSMVLTLIILKKRALYHTEKTIGTIKAL